MASPPPGPYNNQYADQQFNDNSYQSEPPYQDIPPPPPPAHRSLHPAAHPSSSFNQMQEQRQYGISPAEQPHRAPPPSPPRAIVTQGHPISRKPLSPPTQKEAPPPPAHDHNFGAAPGYQRQESYIAPGSVAAGGAVPGMTYDHSEGEGRDQAIRDVDNLYRGPSPINDPFHGDDGEQDSHLGVSQGGRHPFPSQGSSSSVLPIAAAGYAPGQMTPRSDWSGPTLHPQERQMSPYGANGPYQQRRSWYDNPYEAHSISRPPPAGISDIDPNAIADDDDDGLEYAAQHPKRRSLLAIGRDNNSRSNLAGPAAGAAAGAGAGALAAGAAMNYPPGGGVFGNPGSRDASGTYTPVPGGAAPSTGGGSGMNPFEGGAKEADSAWLASQTKGRKKLRWIVGSIVAIVVIAAIVGGVVGGVLGSRKSSSSSNNSSSDNGSGETAAQDDGHGDLGKNSPEIQSLMNNKDLHQVFPGIDYTPYNTQYPACLTNPPSQNNVTRDMAVLSQLTNTLRLYGTDCNQTEMVLHSIQQLELTDMKIWLGVWLGNNDTTNNRQLNDMWTLLEKYGTDPFVGLAVGNEVLFRQDLTPTQLGDILTSVRTNLTSKKIDLPVATSDLGSNWNAQLASEVDVVMANVHPFFAGVTSEVAASWTWSFWQENDVAVARTKKQIISEVGWPSGGGNDCGTDVTCSSKTAGSVAGIDEMNQFMSEWVCQSLTNGTDYFWFEAFDEPWKVVYNDPAKGQDWEDKWGLMDAGRNLKNGVQIPDCGGKTVSRRK